MAEIKTIDYLFVGGGSLGPVTPLLAVIEELKDRGQRSVAFVGTQEGPEKHLVRELGIPYYGLVSGKWRRYWDVKNFTDPFRVMGGFFDAWELLGQLRPKVIVSSGANVAVPVVWAGALRRIPSVIHQQDVRVTLSNRLMKGVASKIFVSLEESINAFPRRKTEWIGNPVRKKILSGQKTVAEKIFSLQENVPTVLFLGGGTGALKLNTLLDQALPQLLSRCQIIHSAGRGKNVFQDPLLQEQHRGGDVLAWKTARDPKFDRYHVFELLTDELPHAFAAADLIICRAGFGTLSEIAALSKPAIVIPMLGTHQEDNARYFERRNAIVTLSEKHLTPELLVSQIFALLDTPAKREELARNVSEFSHPDASSRFADELVRQASGLI